MCGYKLIPRKALKDAEAKAAAETGDLQKTVEALNAALVAEKEANSRSSIDTEGLVKRLTEEIATLKKQIEDAHEASKGASEKNTEALESRQKEIDDLGSAVKVLQEELEKAALESKASEEAIQELQEKHAAELAEAVNTEKTVIEEAEAKLEKLVQEHREQLEKGSEILSAQLQEAKSAAKVLEEDLLQKIEAAKLESAEALETTQKEAAEKIEAVKQENEAQQKQFELTIEVLKKEASDTVESKDKEWESKIDQLTKSNQEQVNDLTTQLDTAREEIQETSRQMELVKQQSEAEIKSAQEQGKEEVAALQSTLEALNKELAVCSICVHIICFFAHKIYCRTRKVSWQNSKRILKKLLRIALRSVATVFFARVESLTFTQMASKLEQAHKVAFDSQRAEYVTEIEKMKTELTSGNEEKYTLLSEKYEALVAQLDSTREAHAVETSRMAGELKRAEEGVAELLQSHSSTISSLEGQLATEKASRVELQAALDAVPDQSAFDALSKHLEMAKAELDQIKTSKDAEIKTLQESLQGAEESKSRLESEVAKEKTLNKELLEKALGLEMEASEAKKELVEKNASVEKSEEEVKDLRASMEADYKSMEVIYRAEADDLKREIKSLKDKLGAGESGMQGKDGAIEKLESEKKEIEATLAALEKEKEALVGENGSLSREKEVLKEEKEASVTSITAELESLKGELNILEKEKETALQTAKTKEADLEKTNQLVSSLEADSTEKSNSLEIITKEKSDLEAEMKQLKAQVDSFEELIKAKESAIEIAIKDSKGLEATLKEQLGATEALVKEKEAALTNSQNESAVKMRVVEAELAELRIKNKVSTEDRPSSEGETGETPEVKKASITGIVSHPISFC